MTQPLNQNFLSTLDFKLVLARSPATSFTIQQLELPGVSMSPAIRPSPFVAIPEVGDTLQFEPLSFTFKVDEDLQNWTEIFTWMQSLGFPENWEQHQRLPYGARTTQDTITSDIELILTTNARNANRKIRFVDCWPSSLTGISFNTTDTSITYAEATATFAYSYFTVANL